MDAQYRTMMDFLVSLGTDSAPQSGDQGFLAHLVGVHRDLQAWGCDQDVCRAGLFHSIYGTELFRRFSLPLDRRGDVQQFDQRASRMAGIRQLRDGPLVLRSVDPDGRTLSHHESGDGRGPRVGRTRLSRLVRRAPV